MNWNNISRYKQVKKKEDGRKYSTDEMLASLSVGDKAWVLNHVGYKSYLSKGEDGTLLWRVDEGDFKGYRADFWVDESDWDMLIWFIEIQ